MSPKGVNPGGDGGDVSHPCFDIGGITCLLSNIQSAYRSQHSTETAILKIHNDIIEGLDAGKCTVLSSLDLSAAFDTVDHTICIRRLSHLYGVDGTVLQWFESFLSNRDNKVCVNDVFSLS